MKDTSELLAVQVTVLQVMGIAGHGSWNEVTSEVSADGCSRSIISIPYLRDFWPVTSQLVNNCVALRLSELKTFVASTSRTALISGD